MSDKTPSTIGPERIRKALAGVYLEARRRRAAVLALRQTGLTHQAIADQIGVSRQRVFALLKKARAD